MKVELPLFSALNVPVPPLTIVHVLVPTSAVFPFNVLLTSISQIFCVAPTVAAVGVA